MPTTTHAADKVTVDNVRRALSSLRDAEVRDDYAASSAHFGPDALRTLKAEVEKNVGWVAASTAGQRFLGLACFEESEFGAEDWCIIANNGAILHAHGNRDRMADILRKRRR